MQPELYLQGQFIFFFFCDLQDFEDKIRKIVILIFKFYFILFSKYSPFNIMYALLLSKLNPKSTIKTCQNEQPGNLIEHNIKTECVN